MDANIAFYPNHPSQLWVLYTLSQSLDPSITVKWYLREKDITVQLAQELQIPYQLISHGSKGLIGNAVEYIRTIAKCISITKKDKIQLWVTKNPSAHVCSKLMGLRSIAFSDDDIEIIMFLAVTSFPFVTKIIAPIETRLGRFTHKKVPMQGTFEMIYLHPKRFSPDPKIYEELGLQQGEPYAIIRLVSLHAHHDINAKGIGEGFLREIIQRVEGKIKILITSERPLSEEFEAYRLPVKPNRIHHALAFAEFFLGDSQTMSTEAALLGTPSLRLNSFVGRISVMNTIEEIGLSIGFLPEQGDDLLVKLDELLAMKNRKEHYQDLKDQFFNSTPDPLQKFRNLITELLNEHSPE